ncbi:MAG: DUF4270 family protein, partial [Bacteroidetes bacterium]|nr:DUF4270 family protein [Bacteroidota bacterium]
MTKLNIGVLFLLLTLVFSCKKKNDDSVLGLDVQPINDLVGITITDTASVYMYTQQVDSVRTYSDQYKYLGSNMDPLFGRTDASIYTNFSISNNLTNVTFGSNPVIDSAQMVMVFMGDAIGDTLSSLTYDIHVLNENLDASRSYYSSSHISYASSKLCSVTGKLKVINSNVCLVLPLNNNFAQYILQTTANLTNNTAFQAAYKGFYITTSNSTLGGPGSGAIRRFDLDNDLSGVNLYYHDGNSASSKGQVFQFSFRGVDALRFNEIKHNYAAGATPNLYDQLNYNPLTGIHSDTTKGNANVYLNCFGGT